MIGHLVIVAAGGRFPAITGSLQAEGPGLIEGPIRLELRGAVHRTKDEVVGGLIAVFEILFRDSKPNSVKGVELANGEAYVTPLGHKHKVVINPLDEGPQAVTAAKVDLDGTVHAVNGLVRKPRILLRIERQQLNSFAARIIRGQTSNLAAEVYGGHEKAFSAGPDSVLDTLLNIFLRWGDHGLRSDWIRARDC